MKNGDSLHIHILALLFALTGSASAQSAFSVVARGPDSNVMQKTNADGSLSRYTVLATGLNYLDASGQLVPSQELISPLPGGGAAATTGRHKLQLPGDIGNGVMQVTTPDGLNLYSQPLCICLSDGSNTVVTATLTNSVGCLTASNQITFPNCFCGLKADIVATYKLSGFECDLVIHERPAIPSQIDASFTTLQLVTEFFNTPDPQQIPAASDDWFGLQDSTLKFGTLTMTHGKAFAFQNSNTNSGPRAAPKPEKSARVYKGWLHMQSPGQGQVRTFLVEQVPLVYVADALNALPASAIIQQTVPKPGGPAAPKMAEARLVFPPARALRADTNQISLASADWEKKPGLVWDYNEFDASLSNFTFTAGSTYCIGNSLYLSNITFQAGTVIKFEGYPSSLNFDDSGTITCDTTPSQPAIFTSMNDDSFGEQIDGSSHNPNYYDVVNFMNIYAEDATLHDLRFSYAYQGVYQDVDYAELSVWNCQFLDVASPILGSGIDLENVLIDQSTCDDAYPAVTSYGSYYLTAEQVTVDSGTFLDVYSDDEVNVQLANCLVVNGYMRTTNYSDTVEDDNWVDSPVVTTPSSPVFKSSGGGNNHYLADDTYRNIGTTSISSAMLSELQTTTTYAPQDGNHLDNDGYPDSGYHYPLNYPYIFTPSGANGSYITNDLLVYYKLNDGSGIIATDSVSGFNAMLMNYPAWGSNFLNLNGSTQYGDAGNVVDLNYQDCSILAWVNESNAPPAGPYSFYGILDKSDLYASPTANGWGYWLDDNNQQLLAGTGNTVIDDGRAPIPPGQWTQIAVVWNYESQLATFYVNGLVNTQHYGNGGSPVQVTSSGSSLDIGSIDNNGASGWQFNGSLKHLAVYAEALTSAELQSNYLQTEAHSNIYYPSLLYYKFAEHSGTNFADSSLNGSTAGKYYVDGNHDVPWTNNPGGIPSSAMHFHGDGTYLETGNSTDFNFTSGPFTVNFWIAPYNNTMTLFENTNADVSTGWSISIQSDDTIILESGSYTVGSIGKVPQAYIPDGEPVIQHWSMVTVVRDSNTHVSIYINGQLDTSGNSFGTIASSSGTLQMCPLCLLNPNTGQPGSFDGDLWGIQIWGQALTREDVANLFINQQYGNNWP